MNVAIMIIFFFLQNQRYLNILNYPFEREKHNEIVRTVLMMKEYGNTMNWIIIISVIIFFLNLFLLKKWVKSKRWILEGIIIFIITISLSIIYNYQKVISYKAEMKTTINQTK